MSTQKTTNQNQEQEINFWSAADILCQAVEAAQAKGGVYSLKDAALLDKCVDLVRATLKQVSEAEAAKTSADAPAPIETETV